MKRCFKCGVEKQRTEFYVHLAMADGRLGKCKECARKDVAARAVEKRDYIREYDKSRFQTEHRKKQVLESARRRRVRHPEKKAAYSAMRKAIRNGVLVRQPCEVCGDPKSQAHHGDYSKPLDVKWYCFKHHREIGHGQKVG